jgi:hypothetical protein
MQCKNHGPLVFTDTNEISGGKTGEQVRKLATTLFAYHRLRNTHECNDAGFSIQCKRDY